MEDAQPTGLMMTLDTFRQAVKFGTYIGCSHFVLSGGEPTENEHITEMCEWLDMATGCTFTIVSSGASPWSAASLPSTSATAKSPRKIDPQPI
jgi:organic radical activating enzyme